MFQRTEKVIPSNREEVILKLGDITQGQVLYRLFIDEETILKGSFSAGDTVKFQYNKQWYTIECQRLLNKAIGNDIGFFKITNDQYLEGEINLLEEQEKIESLIFIVEQSEITFIRNGDEHTSKEAADHLRMKLEKLGEEIKTYDEFIDKCATKSSVSGKPYQVKLNNDSIIDAKSWYLLINES